MASRTIARRYYQYHFQYKQYDRLASSPPVTASGDPDAYHIHDLELHTPHCFNANIVGQVNALALEISVGLLAPESEGSRAALDHERVNDPVTPGSLHMRSHLEHVRVDKLAVLFQ